MIRITIFSCLLLAIAAESVHWQWRELICKGKDEKNTKDATDCEVLLKETEDDPNPRKVPLNTCFDETANGQLRQYCNILCPGAATAYRITRYPQNHRSCFTHITYRIERRGDNFFMWRDGKCRTTNIHFTVRCKVNAQESSLERKQRELQAASWLRDASFYKFAARCKNTEEKQRFPNSVRTETSKRVIHSIELYIIRANCKLD